MSETFFFFPLTGSLAGDMNHGLLSLADGYLVTSGPTRRGSAVPGALRSLWAARR